MAIDLFTEDVLIFGQAAKCLPARRQGKRPHVATLYRWSNQGVGGVKLEYAMVGATRVTSLQALQRFCDQLTAATEASYLTGPANQSTDISNRRRKEIEAAEQRLLHAGI